MTVNKPLLINTNNITISEEKKECSIMFFDTEYNKDKLIQLSYIIVSNKGKILSIRNSCISRYVESSTYYKITNETAKLFGRKLDVVMKEFFESIIVNNVKVIVGHNVEEDVRIIKHSIFEISKKTKSRHLERLLKIIDNIEYVTKRDEKKKSYYFSDIKLFALCTSKLTRNYTKLNFGNDKTLNLLDSKKRIIFKQPKLTELYEKCTGKIFDGNHDSMNDTFATAECFYSMLRNPECPQEFLITIHKLLKGTLDNKESTDKKPTNKIIKLIDIPFNTNSILLDSSYSDGVKGPKNIKICSKKMINILCANNKYLNISCRVLLKYFENIKNIQHINNFLLNLGEFSEKTVNHLINFCLINRLRFVNNSFIQDFDVINEQYIKTLSKNEIEDLIQLAQYMKFTYLKKVTKYRLSTQKNTSINDEKINTKENKRINKVNIRNNNSVNNIISTSCAPFQSSDNSKNRFSGTKKKLKYVKDL